jgi:hypothetical protein
VTTWSERPGPEFTLACEHGSVTSEQMKAAYSEEAGVAVYHFMLAYYDDLTTWEVVKVTIRELLGKLLREQVGCRCAQRPYALVVEEQDGVVIEWHFEDAE